MLIQIVPHKSPTHNPYGLATLSSSLTSLQPYDVTLYLHLPRSPINLQAGNFMIDLSLLSPTVPFSSSAALVPPSLSSLNTSEAVLVRSRRPAILTYASPLIDTAATLSGLPWYVMGWKKESEVLEISMLEGVEFSRGWRNIPNMVGVVVEADVNMQFYGVCLKIIARFRGLRWASFLASDLYFAFYPAYLQP